MSLVVDELSSLQSLQRAEERGHNKRLAAVVDKLEAGHQNGYLVVGKTAVQKVRKA